MSDRLYLLTTDGCSLCEKAKEQLWPVLHKHRLRLAEVDIISDPALLDRFATSIPVICQRPPSADLPDSQFLSWPFDTEQVAAFTERR